MTPTTNCPGCGWVGYPHRHNDAEDGPRATCCDHTCSVVIDDTPNDDGPGRDTKGAPVDWDTLTPDQQRTVSALLAMRDADTADLGRRWARSYGLPLDGFCGNCGMPLRRLGGYLVHEVTADGTPNSSYCDSDTPRRAALA